MRQNIRVAAVAIASLLAAACNTVQGLGQDLEAGGRAMARAAAETRADMQTPPQPAVQEASAPTAPLTLVGARARALTARPGVIEGEETAGETGQTRYLFQVRGEDGALYSVTVDAQTGTTSETRL